MESILDLSNEAEKATMKKIRNLGSAMVSKEELIASFVSPNFLKSESVILQYLANKAEIPRLQREVNEVIRNHEVVCPCGCGAQQKLRELTYLENRDTKFLVRDCEEPTSEWGTPLTGKSLAFVERLTQYSSVRIQDLFDK